VCVGARVRAHLRIKLLQCLTICNSSNTNPLTGDELASIEC